MGPQREKTSLSIMNCNGTPTNSSSITLTSNNLSPSLSPSLLPLNSSMAAIMRTRSRLFSSAPPPSPIATAKGSRSAAVNDQVLREFLEKSLKIPDLTLPESQLPTRIPRRIPSEIDLPSLLSRDEDSVRSLFESVSDLGAFQIIGHGISADEIESVIGGSEQIFRTRQEQKRQLIRNRGTREDFFWCRTGKKEIEKMGSDTLRMFRERMDGMFVKMEGIAEDVGQVLSEHIRKRHQKKTPETESVLCLHKYSHKKLEEGNSSFDIQVEKDDQECCSSHALSLHLCCEDLQFRIRSQKASVSFNVVAGAIVITVGEQLQEWSHGDMEFVIGEPVFEPGIDADPSFTLEFMCSPPSLNHKLSHVTKTISLVDQMLIALITLFLYSILTYISSKLAKT